MSAGGLSVCLLHITKEPTTRTGKRQSCGSLIVTVMLHQSEAARGRSCCPNQTLKSAESKVKAADRLLVAKVPQPTRAKVRVFKGNNSCYRRSRAIAKILKCTIKTAKTSRLATIPLTAKGSEGTNLLTECLVILTAKVSVCNARISKGF